jgi:ferredoxin-type protein NapG
VLEQISKGYRYNMDRKTFFQKGFSKFIGKVVKETAEVVEEIGTEFKKIVKPIEEVAEDVVKFPELTKENKIPKKLKRPPGSLEDNTKFKEKCTGCGDCIYGCPYNVLFPVFDDKANKSLPFMDVNTNACMMCKDYPCIKACSHEALKPYKKKQKPKFGQARSLFPFCINFESQKTDCNQCQTACPVESVITFKKGKPSFSLNCTGCGICVQTCPVFPKAIVIK